MVAVDVRDVFQMDDPAAAGYLDDGPSQVVDGFEIAGRFQRDPLPPGHYLAAATDDVDAGQDSGELSRREPDFPQPRHVVLDEDLLLLDTLESHLGHVVEMQQAVADILGDVAELAMTETFPREGVHTAEHVAVLVVHHRVAGAIGQIVDRLHLAAQVVEDGPHVGMAFLEVGGNVGKPRTGFADDVVELRHLLYGLLDPIRDELFHPQRTGPGKPRGNHRRPDCEPRILLLGQVETGDGAVEHYQCRQCVHDGAMPHRRIRDACHVGPGQSTLTFMPSRMTEMPAVTTRSPEETPEITSRPRDVSSPTSTGLRRITPTPASSPSASV